MDMPDSVCKVVFTPAGSFKVISDFKGFVQQQLESREKRLYSKNGFFHCLRCHAKAVCKVIVHYIANYRCHAEILVIKEDTDPGKIIGRKTYFCPSCDQEPEFQGLPIAPPGSFYNPIVVKEE